MDTNEKQHVSPAERRRRTEMRKRRQKEIQRRKRRRLILLILGGIFGIAALAGIIFGVSRLVGSPEISAKGDTFVIAIDPGHGGEDTGMSAEAVMEKAADLKICSKLKIMLESQGCQVIMTREEDTRLSKEERVKLANESGADLLVSVHCNYKLKIMLESQGCQVIMTREEDTRLSKEERVKLANESGADLLVSVHCNYSEEDESLSGARTSYKKGDKKAKALAENVQEALVKETGAADGGTEKAEYTILTDTEMPAVLVEAGYLSSEAEAAKLAEDTYQNDVAKGIAKGILASLKDN